MTPSALHRRLIKLFVDRARIVFFQFGEACEPFALRGGFDFELHKIIVFRHIRPAAREHDILAVQPSQSSSIQSLRFFRLGNRGQTLFGFQKL
jgi:hypothetical protein